MTEIAELVDKLEIGELVARFFASLDERQADPRAHPFDEAWARRFFTEDVRFRFPVGAFAGRDIAPRMQTLAMDMWGRTQHLAGIPLVELDGDQASVRWDAVHTHVQLESTQAARADRPGELMMSGGHYDAEVARTGDGWRFRVVVLTVAWTTGKPPVFNEELARLSAS
ncbi:nuclear transport factor 2 family protein [Actinomadura litoris]|uniref:Nuclear transport factor 2 family protein n=1 Tax=Actinomadura litoris TaxID=2678616 RepID=A0A7K1KY77_9ACTN|nr:nuclear transport factor 2 family protein [Actinomadura litoris]MUN37109.1 nuclear transport factor 2 family protein [Actinomadura litoris]